eukprot:711398-Rhodomonas_salina.1
MLKDHALNTLLCRQPERKAQLLLESDQKSNDENSNDEEDLTITEVMQDHSVELSQEAKQAVGRFAAGMYRAAYNEDPLKNKQVVNGKEQYVAWYKRKHEDLLIKAVN